MSQPIPPTPRAILDERVAKVAANKDAWAQAPIPERVALLRKCIEGLAAVAEAWVQDGARAKGLELDDPRVGEEWIAGPYLTIRNARLLTNAVERFGQPKPPKVTAREDGQQVARVFPSEWFDRLLFTGYSGDVWIEPGKAPTQGRIYREPAKTGKVALVLGAGNVSSIAPMDVLYKLFVENEVVVLKMHPVNEYLGPHFEKALAPLVERGVLAFAYGGAAEGAYLSEHPKIDTLHVTGSDKTYDAIVWGTGDEQAKRKREHTPKNPRPFSAELGCVTPILIVPGPWSAADLAFQAGQVAGMVANNGSFNCNAAKVVVMARGWAQRETFLEKLHEAMAKMAPRKAYYPGALDRYGAFMKKYPDAKTLGATGEGVVPWTAIPDVEDGAGEYALTNEAFCGVLAEVTLDVSDAPEFLRAAVEMANDRCWGTLSCGMIVHPTTEREHGAEVDRAIANLRYGAVAINCWPAMAYALVTTTWGAFPGHPQEDIRSGAGVVHNAFLFDHPQKSVVRAPFVMRPKPVWYPGIRGLAKLGRALTEMESGPTLGKIVKVAAAALRG